MKQKDTGANDAKIERRTECGRHLATQLPRAQDSQEGNTRFQTIAVVGDREDPRLEARF